MKPTVENLAALSTTIFNYEQAILDLENSEPVEIVWKRWVGYGGYNKCLLCKSVGVDQYHHSGCKRCILGPNERGCVDASYRRLKEVIRGRDFDTLLPTLKVRLKSLESKISDRGYYMEECDD